MASAGGEVGVNGGGRKGEPAREIPDKILLLRILHAHLLPALPSPPPRTAPGPRSAPRVFPFPLSRDGGGGARGRREPGARPAAFPGAIAPPSLSSPSPTWCRPCRVQHATARSGSTRSLQSPSGSGAARLPTRSLGDSVAAARWPPARSPDGSGGGAANPHARPAESI